MSYKRIIHYIIYTNWLKTIIINFYYFPFKQAVRLPILVAYRTVFQELKGGVKIEGPLSTGMLLFGYCGLGIHDGFYNRTIWQVCGTVTIKGEKISIGRGSSLCVSGNCFMGNHFTVTGKSTIICKHCIRFGDDVLISWDVLFMDTDYHVINDQKGEILNKDKPIIVGDKVWVGCRTTILKGSAIPSGAVIAAGSVISGKMQKEGCIYTSNRRILKDSITWHR